MSPIKIPLPVKTVFRTFPDGETIALFPEIAHDRLGYFCLSYAHVGQHGCADPLITGRTRPASPAEAAKLSDELRSLGYELTVMRRISRKMDETRMKSVR